MQIIREISKKKKKKLSLLISDWWERLGWEAAPLLSTGCSPGMLLSHTNHCYPHKTGELSAEGLLHSSNWNCCFSMQDRHTYQGRLSQLLSSPEAPEGWPSPCRHTALLSPSARSSTYSSQLLGGERCRFTFALFVAFRAGETCSHSMRDQLQFPGSLCSEVPSNHETFSQNLKFSIKTEDSQAPSFGREYFSLKIGINMMFVYEIKHHHHNNLGLHK